MELFFDVETTGLPQRGSSCTDMAAYESARIVSIAWILRSKTEIVSQHYSIIRHIEGTEPLGASFIHGISREMTHEFGEDIMTVLTSFLRDVRRSDTLVAHNYDFDANVIASELFRMGADPLRFLQHKHHCTMKSNTNLVKDKSKRGYKWPKLSELYLFCFGKEMKLAHNALADTENTAECFYFVRDNIVDLTLEEQ